MILPVISNVNYSYNKSVEYANVPLHSSRKSKNTPSNSYSQNNYYLKNIPVHYSFYSKIENAPNFQGASSIIKSKSAYRNYAKNGHVGCIYCGKGMFVQEEIDKLLCRAPYISKNAKVFVEEMSAFNDYFHKNQKIVLKKIAAEAENRPELSVSNIINSIAPKAEKQVIERQMAVFRTMKHLGELLPDEKADAIKKLIEQFKCRIKGIPYADEYSGKEFFYQVTKLAESIVDKSVANTIYETTQFLGHPAFKSKNGCLPKRVIDKFYKIMKNTRYRKIFISPNDTKGAEKAQKFILLKVKDIATQAKRADIVDLCNVTERKINGLPVVLKFANKAFSYKMNEILQGEDKNVIELYRKLIKKFPTSTNNVNAFIIKHKNSSENRFLLDFLDWSKVSIEHVKPRYKKGADNMGNWVLACRYCNGVHGSDDIYGENFPFNKSAGQRYFGTLIKDANENGLFDPKDIISQIKNFRQQTGIKIDTSKLKYSPEF